MNTLRKWADEHQYDAEPHLGATENGVMPSVHLLHMPDDPLGVLASQNAIYKGKVVRSLSELADDERKQALDDMMRTTLQSPLEAIKMHFVIEGVDRSFTHQMVRQRTANFGQESLRFAVVGRLRDSTTLPPELHGTERSKMFFGTPDDDLGTATYNSFDSLLMSREFTFAAQDERNRAVWDWAIEQVDAAYHYLAEHGIAAEEARGLLPHCTATRLHWQTDMRGLAKVMGERLCTQAQFHWRTVAALVQNAVRTYAPDFSWMADQPLWHTPDEVARARQQWEERHRWQFELLADSGIFRPVCYQTGKCMFQASADRGCTIRKRVDSLGRHGIKSEHWGHDTIVPNIEVEEGPRGHEHTIPAIRTEEWLLNPAAARKQGGAL